MKVLVAGIAGALARLVALQLRARGHQVLGLDSRRWADCPEDISITQVDIRKRAAEDVFRVHRPDCVVHMATVNALSAAGEERERINVGGTKAVFAHSAQHGVKHVVFVGRHTYYGASPDSPLYHTEEEPPRGMGRFPELADLVSADLFAASALWREPGMNTTVLRLVYTLGPSRSGTLASFLSGRRVPLVMGYDPLYHYLDEGDAAQAIATAVEAAPRGIFNVAGPPPLPLSVVVKQVGKKAVALPEGLARLLLGNLGFSTLPTGALEHLKYPIVIDSTAFRARTGWAHSVNEVEVLRRHRLLLDAEG